MRESLDVECCGEPVTIVIDDDGVTFHGWDEEAELALIELGFEPSLCSIVSGAIGSQWRLNGLLHAAAREDDVVFAKALLLVGANPRERLPVLTTAARAGSEGVVEVLLGHPVNVNANGEEALLGASKEGYVHVVEKLLDAGADLGSRGGQSALARASLYDHADVVQVLLDAGAADYVGIDDSMRWARQHGHDDVVAVFESWVSEHSQ